MLIRSALLTENASPGRPKLRSSFAIWRFVDIWPLYRARSSPTRILANHEPKGRGRARRRRRADFSWRSRTGGEARSSGRIYIRSQHFVSVPRYWEQTETPAVRSLKEQ